jgi:hypothetical protein
MVAGRYFAGAKNAPAENIWARAPGSSALSAAARRLPMRPIGGAANGGGGWFWRAVEAEQTIIAAKYALRWSEKGVRLAHETIQVGPCIPVGAAGTQP